MNCPVRDLSPYPNRHAPLLELTRLEETGTAADMLQVDDIVRRAIDKVQALAEAHRIDVAVEGVPSALTVQGDRRQIVRALTNLLDNAVRYSDSGQRVSLIVEPIEDGTSLTVRDEGEGIPRAELERVFERFYRVDRARSRETGGTGLGLAIVRHVAQNHGGKVRVESKPGEGSSFTLQLPVTGPEAV